MCANRKSHVELASNSKVSSPPDTSCRDQDCHAAVSGEMCFILPLMALDTSHKSTARWAFNQNSGLLPNKRERRNAISALTERLSCNNSCTVWRDTPSAFAKLDAVSP